MDKDEFGAVRHAMTAKELDDLISVWKTLLPIAPGRRLTPTGMRLTRCKA